jgi:hypothetical protein
MSKVNIFLVVILLVAIYWINSSKAKMLMHAKSLECTTSGIHVDKNMICTSETHKKYSNVKGVRFNGTIIKPIIESHV